MEKVIEINNLSFSYDKRPILQGIDLTVHSQEFIGLIGANGSGKSTLLKLIVGLLDSNRGQIKLLGQPLDQFDDWTKIGYISQEAKNFNQSFPATVKEVVAANLYHQMGFFKLLSSDLESKIDEALQAVNMLEYQSALIGNLSSGQQQRVFIARTLVANPKIILMDEPLAGVDIKSQTNFYNLIKRLNRQLGLTIIIVTHNIELAKQEVDKLIKIEDGDLVT
ncbi:MAG: metal ABC transporter ATP-binding protein [Bacillota bacterium]